MTTSEYQLLGFKMKSLLMLGSGTITEKKECMISAMKFGAGGAVTRTLRLNPKRELFKPNVFTGEGYMLNADNQNITPWNYWVDAVAEVEKHGRLGISLSAREPKDCKVIVSELENNVPPSFYEVNFSCSHSAELYGRISYETAGKALRIVKELSSKPVLLKLSLDNLSFEKVKKLEEAGLVDGYTLSNSIGPGLRINVETHKPYLKSVVGGMSGRAIKPLVLNQVYNLSKHTKKPIIGVGGIYTGMDVYEYILAGAHAVQVYTAAHERGMGVFKEIKAEFDRMISKKGVDVVDLVGSVDVGE